MECGGDQSLRLAFSGRFVPGAARAAERLKTCRAAKRSGAKIGGEAGIRTLGTGFSPYNGLANRRLQPLGHLTVMIFLTISAIRRCLIRLCSSLCSSSPDLRFSV